jgi:hypothetical protein
MPALLTIPKPLALSASGLALPGAKLYAYQTGTSTPQDTYQDLQLNTAHANPVVADSAGFFSPIYLDPSLPHYRLKLTTSADVQVWQVDDVPSNQNTAQSITLYSTQPKIIFDESDVADSKVRVTVSGGLFLIQFVNAAESSSNDILSVTRGASLAIDSASFLGWAIENDTFSGELTGCTASVPISVEFSRERTLCALRGAASGTSNTTAMTLTGLPIGCRPANNAIVPCMLLDNGAAKGGWALVQTSGTVIFGVGIDNNASGFTGSGTKGLNTGWNLVYPLI